MEAFVSPIQSELRDRLDKLPPNIHGEIIGDTLYTMPKARMAHMQAIGFLGHHIGGRYYYDDDGPGGWRILPEPGIELPNAAEVCPDLAGWRLTTMPEPPPPLEPIRVVPDWVCEVLSPSSVRYDLGLKRKLYTSVGVSWYWIVDTDSHRILVLESAHGEWVFRDAACDDETVRLAPFADTEIPLKNMWLRWSHTGCTHERPE